MPDSSTRSPSPRTTIPILFLKSPSEPDTYTSHFSSPPLHYTPRHIPPLVTSHFFQSLLALLVSPGPFPYSALIFTSQRAVSTIVQCLSLLSPSKIQEFSTLRIPLYAVGPGTAAALRAEVIGGGMPECWVEGEEAGRGEGLVEIVAGSRVDNENGGNKVLWLTGEKRREGLRAGLIAKGIDVEICVVYGTTLSPEFSSHFRQALLETEPKTGRGGMRWIVIFSAQGGREMLEGLGWLEEGIERVSEHPEGKTTYVASIGPTTKEYLEGEFGFRVDVCAERPSPERVRQGIERFMRENGIGGF